MLVVIRCFNRMPPLVVETFEGHDEQTVIHDSKE